MQPKTPYNNGGDNMSYIYKITNDINDKIYIGKTDFSIEKRFKEHCQDAFRDRNEKDLYMQQCGSMGLSILKLN